MKFFYENEKMCNLNTMMNMIWMIKNIKSNKIESNSDPESI